MTWKHTSSHLTKKVKVSYSAGKFLLTVNWNAKFVIFIDFFTSVTINLARYCETLTKLRPGLLFLDDNAIPNTARDTKEHIRLLGWERLDDPGYGPDLVASDFHLFPAWKSAPLGRHLRSNSEVRLVVENFLRSLGTDFYQDGFLKLISLNDKCINVGGEYLEK
ncbi:hypothetical protein AVEN_12372-1 [Araneus ventricosus]|uniref:Tc1-like transposase DDE domain-containing protein n=1 Tax=Araneus ventricosus TaxID=182803 RepID=A0A4Y2JCX0_ARAVE|nr:hypothetical protein AVEN_12372-1 [Araneus ventricosus]